jgi:hypothetical protein
VDLDGQQAGPSGLSQRREAESSAREGDRGKAKSKNNAQMVVLSLVNCVVGGLLPKPNSRFTRRRNMRQSFYWSGQ